MSIVFWVSVLVMVYIYIGYPSIVYLLSKIKSNPDKNYEFLPSITIIISVYNEEKLIQKKIDNLFSLNYPDNLIEVIIVTDGSNDATASIIRKHSSIKLIESKERLGKAECVNRAVAAAHNDILILMDVRQTVEQNAIKELVSNLSNDNVGAVSGELVYRESSDINQTIENAGFYWKYEKMIRKAESKVGSVQGVTGALYAIKKDLMPQIKEGTILDDVYVPMTVIKNGYRVLFEPQAVIYDDASVDEAIERKRKIRTIAGNYQLISMNKWLLSPILNPTFFQYFSHKVLRLMSPFILAITLIALFYLTIFNYGLFYKLLLLLVALVFLFTYIKGIKIKFLYKVIKINHAFLQLNYYALLGCIEYIKNKNIYLWK